MAAEGDIIIQFTFTGEDSQGVPPDVTHVTTVDESVTVIPEGVFSRHPNIVEVDCHDGVEKVEERAFKNCPSLIRVKIRGVKTVGSMAFWGCAALTDVECDKLERIGERAFGSYDSLRSINLPSVKIVETGAFAWCTALTEVRFSETLETIGGWAFNHCRSLERITLPLKDGIITADGTFAGCVNLRHVDLVGGVHEFVDALPLDEWKNDMKEEINSINQILPNTPPGRYDDYGEVGEKGRAVSEWIKSVLRKLVDYKQQHRDLLMETATTLVKELALPQDIVIYEIIPFLELSSYTFKGEE